MLLLGEETKGLVAGDMNIGEGTDGGCEDGALKEFEGFEGIFERPGILFEKKEGEGTSGAEEGLEVEFERFIELKVGLGTEGFGVLAEKEGVGILLLRVFEVLELGEGFKVEEGGF